MQTEIEEMLPPKLTKNHFGTLGLLGLLVLFCKTNGFKRMDSLLQYVHRR